MKNNRPHYLRYSFLVIAALVLIAGTAAFTERNTINDCYLSFKGPAGLKADSPDRLPETGEKVRMVKTTNGEAKVTRIDGYRVLYNTKKEAFVNLKAELSESSSYAADTVALIENLRYLISKTQGMESNDVMVLKSNGYTLYGLSRNSIEKGATLGTFIMFPGNGVTVFIYFNNLPQGNKLFSSHEEYKKHRDAFINDYTAHLKSCAAK